MGNIVEASMGNDFGKYKLLYYMIFFQIPSFFKKYVLFLPYKFYSFLSFFEHLKAYLKSLLHCVLDCG